MLKKFFSSLMVSALILWSISFLCFLLFPDFSITIFMVVSLLIYNSQFPEENFFGSVDFFSSSIEILLVLLASFCLFVSKSLFRKSMLFLTFVVCSSFFLAKSLLHLFILFEVSIFPLFFIILSGGKSPERVSASYFLILYTLVFSLPLYLLSLSSESEGLLLGEVGKQDSMVFIVSLLAFLVKLPLFFLHSWLPRAHVEAPLEGSVLLAGVMA